MKKFDGYLFCSDWDGTLSYNGEISRENIEAIKYFQENGGLFTISTGRHYLYMRDFYDLVKPNTALISLCGTLIYDEEQSRIIREGYVSEPKMPIVDKVMERADLIKSIVVYYDGCTDGEFLSITDFIEQREKIAHSKEYKIVFVTSTESEILELIDYMRGTELNGNFLVRGWPTGLEIYSRDSAKGSAVRFLKEKTGAHTLICAGDYENDIDMLEAADIGYAVANAVEGAKAVADRITVDFRENAIAKIISELDAEISAKK